MPRRSAATAKAKKPQELSVEPGNFTDARKMSALTDGQLYWQITKGRNPMPAFEDKLRELRTLAGGGLYSRFRAPSIAQHLRASRLFPGSPDPESFVACDYFCSIYFTVARALETSLMSGTVGIS